MKRFDGPVLILVWLVGLALIGLSFFWPKLVGGRQVWTDEQAQSFSQAAVELHTLKYQTAEAAAAEKKRDSPSDQKATLGQMHLGPDAASVDPAHATADRLAAQRDAAKAKYDRKSTELEAARSHGQGTANWMRWLGIGLVVVGLFGTIVLNGRETN